MSAADDAAACQRLFGEFARHQDAASPLYARLADGVSDDRPVASLLLVAPPEQRQPVLLFVAVHSLLLDDPTVPLARHYPNLHPDAANEPGDPIAAFGSFCRDRADAITELLKTRQTQTNEIGRAALLLPVFGLLETETGALAHVDVGASAGLNLLTPWFDYRYDPGGSVARGSPITLTCGTRGAPPIPGRHPAITAAVGLDAAPIDVTDPAQARWLEACVWPDQVERFDRLAAAIELANRVGVDVRTGDAVGDLAATVDAATATAGGDRPHPVVTTTWVLNYLSAPGREAFVAALDATGARGDLSWVYAENPALCPELPAAPDRADGPRVPTALVLVRWRAGRRTAVHVADAHPHGRWLHWRDQTRPLALEVFGR